MADARDRDRPVANKHVGQAIDNPDIDIAAMARAQGAVGIGPVSTLGDAQAAISRALDEVRAGRTVVVDVRVLRGYSDAMAEGMTQD